MKKLNFMKYFRSCLSTHDPHEVYTLIYFIGYYAKFIEQTTSHIKTILLSMNLKPKIYWVENLFMIFFFQFQVLKHINFGFIQNRKYITICACYVTNSNNSFQNKKKYFYLKSYCEMRFHRLENNYNVRKFLFPAKYSIRFTNLVTKCLEH